jgi:RNA polymerase-binding transcription factor DksA
MSASNAVTTRLCSICHKPIAPARLEALPTTKLCIECAQTHPAERIDAATLDLSQASPINSNGFAPSD